MASTIPDPIDRATAVPDVRAGEAIRSLDVDPLLGLHNAALAEAGTGTVLQQTWEEGQCSHAGAIPEVDLTEVPIAEWCIPLVSEAHVELLIEVRGYFETLAVGGTVTFRSLGTADEVSVALAEGAAAADAWTTVGALELDEAATVGGTRVDLVQMYLDTDDAAGDVVIEQVHGEIAALASPLAAEVDDASPIGLDRGDPDEPLPGGRAAQLVAGDDAVRPRPLVAFVWSALSTEYSGVDAEDELPDVDALVAMRDLPDHGVVMYARAPGTESGRVAAPPLRASIAEGDAGALAWTAYSSPSFDAGGLFGGDPDVSVAGVVNRPSDGAVVGLSIWTRPDVEVL